MKITVVLSTDGKLVTDQELLKRFQISPKKFSGFNWERIQELEVTMLPIILGGQETPTLTGAPGAFLEIPIEFFLVSKQVKKGICLLKYQKKK